MQVKALTSDQTHTGTRSASTLLCKYQKENKSLMNAALVDEEACSFVVFDLPLYCGSLLLCMFEWDT